MSVESVNTTSISIYVWQAQLDSEFEMGGEGCGLIAGTQGSLPWSGSRKEILHTMTSPCRKVQVKHGPRAVG